MATYTKLPSGNWRAQVRKGGAARSATFKTKKEASAWASSIEVQVTYARKAGVTPMPSDFKLMDFIDVYSEEVGAIKPFMKTKTATLAMLRRTLGELRMVDITPLVLQDFITLRTKQGAGGVTISADLSFLSSLYKWIRHVKKFEIDEFLPARERASLHHKGLKTRSSDRTREPTADEVERILHAYTLKVRQKIDMRVVIRFAMATAMRQAEICRIRIEDVDMNKRTVIIRDRKDPREKIGNDQIVPLLPDAWHIFLNVKGQRTRGEIFPYNEHSVSASFTRICKELEIKDLHFHDLRHKAISDFFAAGLGIEQVAILSGHKDWKMLKRYTHIKPEDIHKAFEVKNNSS